MDFYSRKYTVALSVIWRDGEEMQMLSISCRSTSEIKYQVFLKKVKK